MLNHRLTDRSLAGKRRVAGRGSGRWVPNPANALLFVACVTAIGHARLQREDAGQRPVVDQRAKRTPHAPDAPIRPEGQVPDRRRHEDMRNVARRVVALEPAVEAVGDRIVGRSDRSESTRRTPTRHRPRASTACSSRDRTVRATNALLELDVTSPCRASCRRCCDTG